MVAFIEIFITFLALLALCGFVAYFTSLPAGAAPLLVLCGTMVWYSIFGCFDLLFVGGLLWFAAALAAAVLLFLRRGSLRLSTLLDPGFVFFLVAGLLVLVLFAVRQPLFMEWDEFSFWGIAAKVVKTTGHLYTFQPGEMRVTTYVPGLIMLDYAFQFLGAAFAPWKVFVAYDLLMLAGFAAALSAFRRRDWAPAAPMAVVLALTPFVLTVYNHSIYVQQIYMSSYADIPMGVLLGAALAVYFAAEKKTPAVLLATAFAVTAESISKDMGFALCLIAAALVCFDLLFIQNGEVVFAKLRGLVAKLCWCAVLVAMPVAAFLGWAAHMGAVLGVSRFDIGGSGNMGMVQMVTTGLVELVGPTRSEKFVNVMGNMVKAFFTTRLTMIGSGLAVAVLVLTVLAVAYYIGSARQKKTAAWFAILSFLGFVAFYVFTGFTYVYVFKDVEAASLSNYNRYIYPYYIGWVVAALAVLARSLADRVAAKVPVRTAVWQGALFAVPYVLLAAFLLPSVARWQAEDAVSYKLQLLILAAGVVAVAAVFGLSLLRPLPVPLVSLVLPALAVVLVLRTAGMIRPQLSVLDYPDSYFAPRREAVAHVQQLKSELHEGERVFYINQGDDGKGWFVNYYDFYPEITLDYSLGGGTLDPATEFNQLRVPAFFTPQQVDYFTSPNVTLTPAVLCDYLQASGCTALYVDNADDAFRQNYGALFTDGLAGGSELYRVEGTGQAMRFVPIETGVSAG